MAQRTIGITRLPGGQMVLTGPDDHSVSLTSYELPGVAETFGMRMRHRRSCADRSGTDGSVRCDGCGQTAAAFAAQGRAYLERIAGSGRRVRDRFGYFAGVLVAGLALWAAVASPVLAAGPVTIPGRECFPDPDPATWNAYAMQLDSDAAVQELDDCLQAAGWQTVDDDAGGRELDWPAHCFGTPERGAWAAIRAAMTPAERAQLAGCLRRAGWDGLD